MQTSTKMMIAGALIALPVLALVVSHSSVKTLPVAQENARPLGAADANGDGMLTKDEWVARAQVTAERKFAEFDLDHNGGVTRAEIDTVRQQRRQAKMMRQPAPAARPAPDNKR